jgi:pyruvate/oxaloacetate carboxyltransferase
MEGLHMTTPTPMDELIAALKAAKGHMLNAKIDLETNAPKRAAINTLSAGLDLIDVALRTTKL